MLKENIKILRKQKGLSQEELSIKLNVVRQTISKWEQGLSVPDAEMLVSISEALDTSVSTLLGQTITEVENNELKIISEKLELINRQLYQQIKSKRKKNLSLLIIANIIIVLTFILFLFLNSPYLNWNYNNPETAVMGVIVHAFEWTFIRVAPILLIISIIGIIIEKRKTLS